MKRAINLLFVLFLLLGTCGPRTIVHAEETEAIILTESMEQEPLRTGDTVSPNASYPLLYPEHAILTAYAGQIVDIVYNYYPEYKNETLNYFKNVILMTYYPKIQKKSGVAICTELIQSDRTGYIRWDCLDILTGDAGRTKLASLLQTIPNSYDVLKIPEDHPTLQAHASMTFWNSLLVYCSHLPATLNNQVPLEVFRQLADKGPTTITRILSMACLSVNGTEEDVAFLQGLVKDKTPLNNWGMAVPTLGALANYTSKTLDARVKAAAAKAAAEIADAKQAKALDEAAKAEKAEAKPAEAKPAEAAGSAENKT